MLNHKTKGGEKKMLRALLQKLLDISYRMLSMINGLIPI